MGIYLQFWHCHPDGLAEEFLAGPLGDFESWCHTTLEDFPGDIEPDVIPLLQAVRTHDHSALFATNRSEAMLVDHLIDVYYGLFCDIARPDLKRAADSSLLAAERYRRLFDTVTEPPGSRRALELWNCAFNGRPICRDPTVFPYTSRDGVFHISYWSSEEVTILHKTIATLLIPPSIDSRVTTATINALANAHAQKSGLVVTVA